MEELDKNNHDTDTNEDNVSQEITNLHGKHYSQTSAGEDCATIHKETEQSCLYKPLPSPKLRKRKQPISMFEERPNAKEIIEIQEICIETGTQQWVKECVTILPEITSSVQSSDESRLSSELYNTRSLPTTSDEHPEVSDRESSTSTIIL